MKKLVLEDKFIELLVKDLKVYKEKVSQVWRPDATLEDGDVFCP